MLAGLEDAGGAEEHGDMRVVPARVHLPGDPALVLPLHRLLQPPHRETRRQVRSGQASAIFQAEPGTAGQLAGRSPFPIVLLCQTRVSGQAAIVRKRRPRPPAFCFWA